jgi:hypothetical protein
LSEAGALLFSGTCRYSCTWRCSTDVRSTSWCESFSSMYSREQTTAEKESLEEIVLTRLVRLNASLQGIVTGLVAGLGVFIATNWLLIRAKEGEVVGPYLSLLGQFFIGYEVTFVGSLIGFAYAFVCGFGVGYAASSMYNYIVGRKETPSVSSQT